MCLIHNPSRLKSNDWKFAVCNSAVEDNTFKMTYYEKNKMREHYQELGLEN